MSFNQEQVHIWILYFYLPVSAILLLPTVWVRVRACPKNVLWLCPSVCMSGCVPNERLCSVSYRTAQKPSYGGRVRDTLQKSLTKFNKELSHWLQPTLTNPDEEQINIIKQYSSIAFHIFGGDSFYKIAFNLCVCRFRKWYKCIILCQGHERVHNLRVQLSIS